MSLEMLTPEELAEITSLNVRTIVRLAQTGVLPAIKFSGRWRFMKKDIEDYIQHQARHRAHRILAVDDNEEVLGVLKGNIEEMGHVFIGASNGDEALDILKRDPKFSLLIIDLVMPGKTGVDIMAWLKKNKLQIPVVIFTAHVEHKLCEKAMKYQFFSVLSKPAKNADIQRCVALILGGVSVLEESA